MFFSILEFDICIVVLSWLQTLKTLRPAVDMIASQSRKPLISWIAYLSFTSTKQAFAFVRTFGKPSPFSTNSSLNMSSSKTVLVPIADGSEEIETTCITDTLTRFGADVTVASVQTSLTCTMSRGIKIQADCSISEAATKDWDLIALPGGMPGAEHLRDSKDLAELLAKQKECTSGHSPEPHRSTYSFAYKPRNHTLPFAQLQP